MRGNNAYHISILNISGTVLGQFPLRLFSLFRQVQKRGALPTIQVKDLFLNITNKEVVIQYGKFRQAILVAEHKMDNLMKNNLPLKSKATSSKNDRDKVELGAKPGHGGMLLGAKVSPEIAKARNVPLYQDVISPHKHF